MNIICNDIICVFQTEYLGVKVSLQEFHEMGQVVWQHFYLVTMKTSVTLG